MSVELDNISNVLKKTGKLGDVASATEKYSKQLKKAVWDHTLAGNGIFAYETNGYGGLYIMDDANVPSLVSLPYLGFLDRNDKTYKKTKDAMFSRANPYYAVGKEFQGIG